MKKSSLYSRTGDTGITSLVGGKRISKAAPALEAYGTIDELNSFIGYLRSQMSHSEHTPFLYSIQQQLFAVGGYLACDVDSAYRADCLKNLSVQPLEEEINRLDETLPPLNRFVIPGENPLSALSHVCRTVCRRAERLIVRMSEETTISAEILVFTNRLSDYFFVLARTLSEKM